MKTLNVILTLLALLYVFVIKTTAEPSRTPHEIKVVQEFQSEVDEEQENVSEALQKIFGNKGNKHSSDLLYELTGYRNETEAIKYVKSITGLKSRQKVYEFIKKCRGSRNWAFIIEFLTTLQGTSNIKVIVNLLRELTNEMDVFKAFNIMKPLTGHADFDAIFESLQKISGERYSHEICDYFKHKSHNHVDGMEGVRQEVLSLTGGMGPGQFPTLLEVLLPEVDMKGAFNLLILSTRTGEIGEAINAFVRIMKAKSFSDAILTLKKVTKQAQLKYAVEELIQYSNRVSIKVIAESLYKITGGDTMDDVQKIFNKVFESDNIVSVIQSINKVTKTQDALYFLASLLDVTQAKNIKGASAVIKKLTIRNMPFLDILEQIRVKSGHDDILDFFKKLLQYTGTKSLDEAWKEMHNVIFITDIFFFFETVAKYTRVDVMVFIETILKITNSTNLNIAAAMLTKICNKRSFFEAIELIHDITNMDVVKFFELIITISPRFYFEEVVIIIEEYTDTTNFLDALQDIRRATGQPDIRRAIEYIKQNKPRVEKTTSTTTTTTTTTTPQPETTTTFEEGTEMYDYESEYDSSESIYTSDVTESESITSASTDSEQVNEENIIENSTQNPNEGVTTTSSEYDRQGSLNNEFETSTSENEAQTKTTIIPEIKETSEPAQPITKKPELSKKIVQFNRTQAKASSSTDASTFSEHDQLTDEENSEQVANSSTSAITVTFVTEPNKVIGTSVTEETIQEDETNESEESVTQEPSEQRSVASTEKTSKEFTKTKSTTKPDKIEQPLTTEATIDPENTITNEIDESNQLTMKQLSESQIKHDQSNALTEQNQLATTQETIKSDKSVDTYKLKITPSAEATTLFYEIQTKRGEQEKPTEKSNEINQEDGISDKIISESANQKPTIYSTETTPTDQSKKSYEKIRPTTWEAFEFETSTLPNTEIFETRTSQPDTTQLDHTVTDETSADLDEFVTTEQYYRTIVSGSNSDQPKNSSLVSEPVALTVDRKETARWPERTSEIEQVMTTDTTNVNEAVSNDDSSSELRQPQSSGNVDEHTVISFDKTINPATSTIYEPVTFTDIGNSEAATATEATTWLDAITQAKGTSEPQYTTVQDFDTGSSSELKESSTLSVLVNDTENTTVSDTTQNDETAQQQTSENDKDYITHSGQHTFSDAFNFETTTQIVETRHRHTTEVNIPTSEKTTQPETERYEVNTETTIVSDINQLDKTTTYVTIAPITTDSNEPIAEEQTIKKIMTDEIYENAKDNKKSLPLHNITTEYQNSAETTVLDTESNRDYEEVHDSNEDKNEEKGSDADLVLVDSKQREQAVNSDTVEDDDEKENRGKVEAVTVDLEEPLINLNATEEHQNFTDSNKSNSTQREQSSNTEQSVSAHSGNLLAVITADYKEVRDDEQSESDEQHESDEVYDEDEKEILELKTTTEQFNNYDSNIEKNDTESELYDVTQQEQSGTGTIDVEDKKENSSTEQSVTIDLLKFYPDSTETTVSNTNTNNEEYEVYDNYKEKNEQKASNADSDSEPEQREQSGTLVTDKIETENSGTEAAVTVIKETTDYKESTDAEKSESNEQFEYEEAYDDYENTGGEVENDTTQQTTSDDYTIGKINTDSELQESTKREQPFTSEKAESHDVKENRNNEKSVTVLLENPPTALNATTEYKESKDTGTPPTNENLEIEMGTTEFYSASDVSNIEKVDTDTEQKDLIQKEQSDTTATADAKAGKENSGTEQSVTVDKDKSFAARNETKNYKKSMADEKIESDEQNKDDKVDYHKEEQYLEETGTTEQSSNENLSIENIDTESELHNSTETVDVLNATKDNKQLSNAEKSQPNEQFDYEEVYDDYKDEEVQNDTTEQSTSYDSIIEKVDNVSELSDSTQREQSATSEIAEIDDDRENSSNEQYVPVDLRNSLADLKADKEYEDSTDSERLETDVQHEYQDFSNDYEGIEFENNTTEQFTIDDPNIEKVDIASEPLESNQRIESRTSETADGEDSSIEQPATVDLEKSLIVLNVTTDNKESAGTGKSQSNDEIDYEKVYNKDDNKDLNILNDTTEKSTSDDYTIDKGDTVTKLHDSTQREQSVTSEIGENDDEKENSSTEQSVSVDLLNSLANLKANEEYEESTNAERSDTNVQYEYEEMYDEDKGVEVENNENDDTDIGKVDLYSEFYDSIERQQSTTTDIAEIEDEKEFSITELSAIVDLDSSLKSITTGTEKVDADEKQYKKVDDYDEENNLEIEIGTTEQSTSDYNVAKVDTNSELEASTQQEQSITTETAYGEDEQESSTEQSMTVDLGNSLLVLNATTNDKKSKDYEKSESDGNYEYDEIYNDYEDKFAKNKNITTEQSASKDSSIEKVDLDPDFQFIEQQQSATKYKAENEDEKENSTTEQRVTVDLDSSLNAINTTTECNDTIATETVDAVEKQDDKKVVDYGEEKNLEIEIGTTVQSTSDDDNTETLDTNSEQDSTEQDQSVTNETANGEDKNYISSIEQPVTVDLEKSFAVLNATTEYKESVDDEMSELDEQHEYEEIYDDYEEKVTEDDNITTEQSARKDSSIEKVDIDSKFQEFIERQRSNTTDKDEKENITTEQSVTFDLDSLLNAINTTTECNDIISTDTVNADEKQEDKKVDDYDEEKYLEVIIGTTEQSTSDDTNTEKLDTTSDLQGYTEQEQSGITEAANREDEKVNNSTEQSVTFDLEKSLAVHNSSTDYKESKDVEKLEFDDQHEYEEIYDDYEVKVTKDENITTEQSASEDSSIEKVIIDSEFQELIERQQSNTTDKVENEDEKENGTTKQSVTVNLDSLIKPINTTTEYNDTISTETVDANEKQEDKKNDDYDEEKNLEIEIGTTEQYTSDDSNTEKLDTNSDLQDSTEQELSGITEAADGDDEKENISTEQSVIFDLEMLLAVLNATTDYKEPKDAEKLEFDEQTEYGDNYEDTGVELENDTTEQSTSDDSSFEKVDNDSDVQDSIQRERSATSIIGESENEKKNSSTEQSVTVDLVSSLTAFNATTEYENTKDTETLVADEKELDENFDDYEEENNVELGIATTEQSTSYDSNTEKVDTDSELQDTTQGEQSGTSELTESEDEKRNSNTDHSVTVDLEQLVSVLNASTDYKESTDAEKSQSDKQNEFDEVNDDDENIYLETGTSATEQSKNYDSNIEKVVSKSELQDSIQQEQFGTTEATDGKDEKESSSTEQIVSLDLGNAHVVLNSTIDYKESTDAEKSESYEQQEYEEVYNDYDNIGVEVENDVTEQSTSEVSSIEDIDTNSELQESTQQQSGIIEIDGIDEKENRSTEQSVTGDLEKLFALFNATTDRKRSKDADKLESDEQHQYEEVYDDYEDIKLENDTTEQSTTDESSIETLDTDSKLQDSTQQEQIVQIDTSNIGESDNDTEGEDSRDTEILDAYEKEADEIIDDNDKDKSLDTGIGTTEQVTSDNSNIDKVNADSEVQDSKAREKSSTSVPDTESEDENGNSTEQSVTVDLVSTTTEHDDTSGTEAINADKKQGNEKIDYNDENKNHDIQIITTEQSISDDVKENSTTEQSVTVGLESLLTSLNVTTEYNDTNGTENLDTDEKQDDEVNNQDQKNNLKLEMGTTEKPISVYSTIEYVDIDSELQDSTDREQSATTDVAESDDEEGNRSIERSVTVDLEDSFTALNATTEYKELIDTETDEKQEDEISNNYEEEKYLELEIGTTELYFTSDDSYINKAKTTQTKQSGTSDTAEGEDGKENINTESSVAMATVEYKDSTHTENNDLDESTDVFATTTEDQYSFDIKKVDNYRDKKDDTDEESVSTEQPLNYYDSIIQKVDTNPEVKDSTQPDMSYEDETETQAELRIGDKNKKEISSKEEQPSTDISDTSTTFANADIELQDTTQREESVTYETDQVIDDVEVKGNTEEPYQISNKVLPVDDTTTQLHKSAQKEKSVTDKKEQIEEDDIIDDTDENYSKISKENDLSKSVQETGASELTPTSSPVPRPPGQPGQIDDTTQRQTADKPTKSGGKLSLNPGPRVIMQALQTELNLKIVQLPDGPDHKNCFCTCQSNSPPKLIPLSDLP